MYPVIELIYGNGDPNWRARQERGEDVAMWASRVATFDSREEAESYAAQRRGEDGPAYTFYVPCSPSR